MNNIRKTRIRCKMTQAQLAMRSGLSQPYINELETGKKSNPSIAVLIKLARAMGTSIEELIREDDSEEHHNRNLLKISAGNTAKQKKHQKKTLRIYPRILS